MSDLRVIMVIVSQIIAILKAEAILSTARKPWHTAILYSAT